MKRQTRKPGRKLPTLWAEATNFEVAISLARTRVLREEEIDPSLEDKIIVLPLATVLNYPHTPPPPLAA